MLLLLSFSFACTRGSDDSAASTETDDSATQPETPVVDEDGDGSAPGADCDDADVTVHPGATELCNAVDDDCDGQIDEAAIDFTTYYRDADGDGFGLAGHTHQACAAPTGYVDNDDDCDDNDAALNAFSVWYVDLDGDGYGIDEAAGTGCLEAPELVLVHGDCDDARPDTYPTAPELCDAYDNDCDGGVDDDPADPPVGYYDNDGDQWGDATKPMYACDAPGAAVPAGFDCDDADAAIHPNATETCEDALDVDCSGRPSNGCTSDLLAEEAAAWAWTGEYDFGRLAARAGDVDGDGMDDIIAGTYGWNGNYGVAYLLSGNTTPGTYEDVELAAEARIFGDAASDYLGYDMRWAGDIDDDGYDDVVIGSRQWDYSSCYNCGVSSFFFGPLSGRYEQHDADAFVEASTAYATLGTTATAGDFDNDGFDDVIVGSYDSSVAGTSYTYNGSLLFVRGPISGDIDPRTHPSATFQGDTSDYAATGVTTLRDADGDGLTDFAVGAYRHVASAGAVYLYYGPISGSMTSGTADVTYRGRATSDYFGYRVEWAGDMDGDGTLDLAASALDADEGGSSAGTVYVLYGPHDESIDMSDAQAWFYGNGTSQSFGCGLAEGADLDADGFDDLFVGDCADNVISDDEGAAYVFYGPAYGPRVARSADFAVTGTETNAYIGNEVDTLDFDGDGGPDLLVAAYGDLDTVFLVPNTSF